MIIKKIKLKNIRSYLDEEIEFPAGSILVSGDIGSGKTSLLLAIEYALFGLQPGQKGNQLLRNNTDFAEVTLEFELPGKEVEIKRKLKRTPRGISNEFAAISINGKMIESSITEIKSKVVQLLGYPAEFVKKNNLLYRYTVYTPQEQMKQIVLEDAETRLNVLRHIFGIDRYRIVKENLLILTDELKDRSKVIQGEIKSLPLDIENTEQRKKEILYIEEKIKFIKIELEKKVSERKTLELEVNEIKQKLEDKIRLEGEIEKSKIMIANKKENLFLINRELADLTKLTESDTRFDEKKLLEVLTELKSKKENLESVQSKFIEVQGKFSSLEKEKLTVLNRKETLFKIEICPTCLQDVPDVHKHNILNNLEINLVSIRRETDQLSLISRELVHNMAYLKTELERLENLKINFEIQRIKSHEVEKAKEKVSSIEKTKSGIESDIIMLDSHIVSLKEKILTFSPLDFKLKKKDEELRNALVQEKKSEIMLAESTKELQISQREIDLLEKGIAIKLKLKEKLSQIEELIEWFSAQFLSLVEMIERNVMLKLRNEFSSLFRKWFSILVSENGLDSQIDENFTPIIIQGGAEMDYSFLSGGERTAVALAYRLALNQTINSFLSKIKTQGIIILDEPTDGFSDAQIEKMRDILEELNTDQLIIVSHEQKIEGFVDNIIKIAKEGDVSSVNYPVSETYQKI
jgi:DNA repair protein SbcC/Rad50